MRLSLLASPIIRKYTKPLNAFMKSGMFPNVSNYNAKRCVCCTHLCSKTTIASSVSGRQFSIINNNDFNITSSDLVYFILIVKCSMLVRLVYPIRQDFISISLFKTNRPFT